MAKEDNLTPYEPGEERARENGRKGGIASGETRREKATMRKTLEMLLDQKNKKGTATYRELATFGLLKGAIDGKADNYRLILALLGELEEHDNETPTVNINIVDNSNLESALYEANREEGK